MKISNGLSILSMLIFASLCLAQHEQKITASNTPVFGPLFGYSVAIDGDYAIVGEIGGSGSDSRPGAAYIFKNIGGATWVEKAKLQRVDEEVGDDFGSSVSISGDWALVGRPGLDNNTGAAYFFVRSDTGWSFRTKFHGSEEGDFFGRSVCISGDFAIVGAPGDDERGSGAGAAFTYEGNGFTWTPTVFVPKITAGDAAPGAGFGSSVSLNGNKAIIGAPTDDFDFRRGAAYIFELSTGFFVEEEKLIANEVSTRARFGTSVSINRDFVIVGASEDRIQNLVSGSAFIFEYDGSSWVKQPQLLANDRFDGDKFGASVSISGNYAIIGAHAEGPPANAGAAYIFERAGSGWNQLKKLVASDRASNDRFGWSVSNAVDNFIVGAYFKFGGGAAYVYNLSKLSVEPTSLDFGDNENTKIFEIKNLAFATLNWTAIAEHTWITVNPTTGSTTTEKDRVTVTVDRTGLDAGTQIGNVIVTSDGGVDSVSISVEVPENPVLSVMPDPLVPINFGTQTTSRTIFITNAGTGTLTWNVTAEEQAQPWLSVDPDGGTTTTETDSVMLMVDRTDLVPGTYSGRVFVGSNAGPAVVTVNMEVPAIPVLFINPDTLAFDSTKTTQTFNIINSGAETLAWSVSADQSWITLDPSSGSTTNEADSVNVTASRDGLSSGEHSGTVTVNSNGGTGTVYVSLFVSATPNQAPEIDHTPPPPPLAGQDTQINATIIDDRGVADAELLFRRGGEGSFIIVNMTQSNNSYQGMLPGSELGNLGIEYFINAIDTDNASTQSDTFSLEVVIGGAGVTKSTPQPAGSDQTAYRLISVPLNLDNKSLKDVLEDNLGPFDKSKWRFFELMADQSYSEFPSTSPITPGRAFWLIVKEPNLTIDTGPGKTNRINEEFEIPLNPKWNFVGNPFNFRIPIANVRMKIGSTFMPGNELANRQFIRDYKGSWDTQPVQELLPFDGYAVYGPDSTTIASLLINPDLTAGTGALTKLQSQFSESDPLWSIRILAQIQQARDVDNVAVVYSDASTEIDPRDQPEPPIIGEYVSVYFHYPQNTMVQAKLSTDARPEPIDGEVWEFEVKTNIRDRVTLTFEGLENVPQLFDVWLMDQGLKLSQNLRKENQYTVVGLVEEKPKRLQLVVGRENFVSDKRIELGTIPSAFELFQNFPNPFNLSTAIKYALPQEDRVTLTVYNLLGQEVATLVDDQLQSVGFHVTLWDGRNQHGQPVSSGVYIYRLQTGQFTRAKKMILLQ